MEAENDDNRATDAKAASPEHRREFGSFTREAKAIQEATTELIALIARSRVREFIPEENTRHLTHGAGWSSPASPESLPGEMVQIEDKFTLQWADIVDQNLAIVSASINGIANSMADKQIKNLFQSVSKACDHSGNVVDAAQQSIPDAFMEMLEKIEFGVGADGDVSVPSIYVGPDMASRVLHELESQPPEYQARAEALIEKKKAAALANEEARLNRFRTPAG